MSKTCTNAPRWLSVRTFGLSESHNFIVCNLIVVIQKPLWRRPKELQLCKRRAGRVDPTKFWCSSWIQLNTKFIPLDDIKVFLYRTYIWKFVTLLAWWYLPSLQLKYFERSNILGSIAWAISFRYFTNAWSKGIFNHKGR